MAVLFWFFTYTDPLHEKGRRTRTAPADPGPAAHATARCAGLALRSGLRLRVRRVRGAGAVAAQVLRRRIRPAAGHRRLSDHLLRPAFRGDPRPGRLGLGQWGGNTVTWWVLWISLACLFLLSYPPTTMVIHGIKGDVSVNLGIGIVLFTVLVFVVGLAQGFGKASVYRSLADHYPTQMGVVGGIVGLIGGLGGFVLPIMFGVAADAVGVRSSCFMLMFLLVVVTMIWTWVAEKNEREEILERHADAAPNWRGRTDRAGYRAGICWIDWRPDDETFWQSDRPAHRQPQSVAVDARSAAGLRRVGGVERDRGRTAARRLPVHPKSVVLAGGAARLVRGVLPGAVLLRGADLRRSQLDGVQHRAAVAADAVDRRRGAGPQYQLRGVRRHRPAVRAGGGQLLLQHGQYQLLLSAAAARHRAGPERGVGNLGVGLAQLITPIAVYGGALLDSRRQCAKPCDGGVTTQIWVQNAGFIWVPFIVAAAVAAWFGMDNIATSRRVSPSRSRSSSTSING
jgi:NNP family nitrate/nitrite transporter-like MFS transporter